ncbi:hypothetical protein QM565_33160 [Geitlerinema splendidum]|nr:hypothetical protein [Geitlerinema splendidum]
MKSLSLDIRMGGASIIGQTIPSGEKENLFFWSKESQLIPEPQSPSFISSNENEFFLLLGKFGQKKGVIPIQNMG